MQQRRRAGSDRGALMEDDLGNRRESAQLPANGESAGGRGSRRGGQGLGLARPDCEGGIAGEEEDVSAPLRDDVSEAAEVEIERRGEGFGACWTALCEAIGERGKACHIHEESGRGQRLL